MSNMVKENKYLENHFKQKPIKELTGYSFIVEDYQRGYKWDFNQVLDLLKDINDFNSNGNLDSYCLQPVAVKAMDNSEKCSTYELVDGQQRLTTIYIILKICGVKDLFEISYKTRPESEKFLENINPFSNYEFDLWKGLSEKDIETSLNKRWSDYINDVRADTKIEENYDNVDNYHFFQAALVVRSYFENPKNDRVEFLRKLKDKVKVIWYQDPTEQTANKLFKNLNSGKIRLSASDLIKALFILNLEKENQLPAQIEFEQNKLASEWDDIEQQLHEPKFWSFIIGNTTRNYEDSRIGYLFEVLTGSIEHKNVYECYRSYSNGQTELSWDEITDLFFTLKEWYEDVSIYHRIGFLMRQNIKGWNNLKLIYDIYNNAENKDRFVILVEESLKQSFEKPIKKIEPENYLYDLDTISYHNLVEVRNLLVFVNILTYERIMPDYRLDFDQFYSGKWSVEHIQPQNPKDLSFDNVEVYLKELKTLLENVEINTENQLSEIQELTTAKLLAITEKDKKAYLIKFNNFVTENITNQFNLHGIGNLALLQSKDNSSIGNNSFNSKREQILNIFNSKVAKGSFIPISTVQVFTKFHSKGQVQLDFWSYQDAIDYKNSIAEIMINYLPKNQ